MRLFPSIFVRMTTEQWSADKQHALSLFFRVYSGQYDRVSGIEEGRDLHLNYQKRVCFDLCHFDLTAFPTLLTLWRELISLGYRIELISSLDNLTILIEAGEPEWPIHDIQIVICDHTTFSLSHLDQVILTLQTRGVDVTLVGDLARFQSEGITALDSINRSHLTLVRTPSPPGDDVVCIEGEGEFSSPLPVVKGDRMAGSVTEYTDIMQRCVKS
ncbi:hypothetical protein [Vibrio ouci]|uniref:Uncharacterized protein n=1 Tax=Vibrio ouci TaxID=2499078 RepID=A0A4Y8WD20_9VIBR|nr:hypothetical protein [Vibrio ouci]TFH90258.1 hypothetical protein ELS82_17605 [Vibrio ouci]